MEWLTQGEADVGKWQGVTSTNGRVTALEWPRMDVSTGEVPVELGTLAKLAELWLCTTKRKMPKI